MGTKSTKERHDTSIRDKAALLFLEGYGKRRDGGGERVIDTGTLKWKALSVRQIYNEDLFKNRETLSPEVSKRTQKTVQRTAEAVRLMKG